jgi:hypothetical protein
MRTRRRVYDDDNDVGFEILSIPAAAVGDADPMSDVAAGAVSFDLTATWLDGPADAAALHAALALLLQAQHAPGITDELREIATVEGLVWKGEQVSLTVVGATLVDHVMQQAVFLEETSPAYGRPALEVLIGANIGFLIAGPTPMLLLTVPAGIFAVRTASAAGAEAGQEAGQAIGSVFRAAGRKLARWIRRR